ncbi:hypothetical protein N431DRAFT_442544 [Stipitochalara longipes BDJ]|nr:hypothetical protein N431DRAFT_442544 [Stipitochalara longipes BDJ]
MSTQRWSLRIVLVAVSTGLLALFPLASADYVLNYCSDINTSSMQRNFSIYQSLGLCHDFCVKNYAFAVVEYQYCWCSDYAPGGSNSTCATPCPGYPSEICGDSGGGLFGYLALNQAPLGTGVANSAATSTTATQVTVSATPSPTIGDESSSSSPEDSLPSTSKEEASNPTSAVVTPIISVFTTIGQVHTITVMPTASSTSQNDLTQKGNSGGLGTGGAVGLTVGLVALIAIVSGLVWFFVKRKRQQDAEQYNNVSRRGSTAGLGALGGPVPSRTMSENSRYVLGTDGRQVVETWEPGDGPGSRRSRLMPVDPRLDPFAPVYQRFGDNKSRESVNTLRDDHDYSRRVVHQGPILRATNPDQEHD